MPQEAPEGKAAPAAATPPGKVAGEAPLDLRGTSVAPGLALGVVHRKDYALLETMERVPVEQREGELNRFHAAVVVALSQLGDLKGRLDGVVPADDARILDVHAAYLKDSVFIADVENLILEEQLSLEAAITKVISDFDRISRLVQSDSLRDRALHLRDVGIRVLRNLEQDRAERPAVPVPAEYVLVARDVSIVDMFDAGGQRVLGILTEEGSLAGHAATLARSMGIPTLIGVTGLLEAVHEGDFVIIDGGEGVVRINPDEAVRAQYLRVDSEREVGGDAPDWAVREPRTLDGERLHVSTSCGNLSEVEQTAAYGLDAIGLYRTELLYVIDKRRPTVDALTAHYEAVLAKAHGARVTFRLLHVDSSLELPWLHAEREPNPALGNAGIRALLRHEGVLRDQLRAILRASAGADVRIAIPFVTDAGEVRRVKEILFEERLELRKSGAKDQDQVALGAVIETPSAVLGIHDVGRECDFLLIGLDSLVQYMLASDRDNHEFRGTFESFHPIVLRALRDVSKACEEMDLPLGIFGVTAIHRQLIPFVVGAGLRDICAAPGKLRDLFAALGKLDARLARRTVATAAALSCRAETRSLVDGYRHGYARP